MTASHYSTASPRLIPLAVATSSTSMGVAEIALHGRSPAITKRYFFWGIRAPVLISLLCALANASHMKATFCVHFRAKRPPHIQHLAHIPVKRCIRNLFGFYVCEILNHRRPVSLCVLLLVCILPDCSYNFDIEVYFLYHHYVCHIIIWEQVLCCTPCLCVCCAVYEMILY